MTLPQGPEGVDTTKGLFLTSAHGYGTQSITDLTGNDEDYVKNIYKQRYLGDPDSVFTNPAGPLAQVFGGLAGLPGVIAALVGKLLSVDLSDLTDIGQMIDRVEQVPGTTQLIAVIKELTGVDLGTVFDGVNLTDPGAVVTAIQNAVSTLINKLIATLTGSATGAGGLEALAQVLTAPLGMLGSAAAALAQLAQQQAAGQANLQGQIAALRNQIAGASLDGAFDDFNRPGPALGEKWVMIDGALAIVNGDFVRTNAFAAGLHVTSAKSQKHVVTAKLTAKYPGTVRAVMSSNDTMTNYAAIEARVGLFGDDAIRIVTGSSPRVVVVRRQADYLGYRLPQDCIMSLEYDPDTNAYTARLNGDPIMDPWVDADNAVTHGPEKVRCGLVSNAENAGYLFGLGGIPAGPGLTDFALYDRPLS